MFNQWPLHSRGYYHLQSVEKIKTVPRDCQKEESDPLKLELNEVLSHLAYAKEPSLDPLQDQ